MAWLLVEIDVGRTLDAHGIVEEVEVIEIHGQYLLLGEMSLQLHGDNPLDRLLQQSLKGVAGLFGIDLLGELLGDGRTASGTRLLHDATLDDSSAKGNEVNTGMFVEALVLGCYEGMDEVWRETVVIDRHTVGVVLVPCSDELAIAGIDL